MTKIKEIITFLHQIAPSKLQEDYDNAGLIVGDENTIINGILISLDCTEQIIDEAIAAGCNLVVAHHPIVFSGLKRFNNATYVEKTIIKAIKNEVAIFAIHTNLDNVIDGVNKKICDKIGLINTKILAPKAQTLKKITTFSPPEYAEKITNALHLAGAGKIGNYKECAFFTEGIGTYTPIEGSSPFVGKINEISREKEVKIEMIFPSHLQQNILKVLRENHPYEEVAFYLNTLDNENQEIGAGMIGELPKNMDVLAFFKLLKINMDLKVFRHTAILKNNIKKIAVCGGSGSFLTKNAIASQADVFISSDYKYHEFFDANDKILIVDIGHFESEKYTIDLIFDLISNNFSNFALRCTKLSTNPVNYYY